MGDQTQIVFDDMGDEDSEMKLLLGNRMSRCKLFGDTFRPLYACYKHSHGEFQFEQSRASLAECVGCTEWASSAEVAPAANGGVVKDAKRRGARRRDLKGGARKLVCDCGTTITTNALIVDCLKCGKIHVFDEGG